MCQTLSPTNPTTQVAEYSMYLAPARTEETNGSASRTSTTTFDAAGRVVQQATAVAGVPGSVAVPTTTTEYASGTGLVTATVSLSSAGAELGRIRHSYDLWGRGVTYTDTDGAVTTTAYDAAGRVASVVDPKGTTTFTYDGASERRGLLTGMSTTGVGSFSGSYDARGNLVTQTLPGGITQRSVFDRAGQQVELAYQTSSGAELAAWAVGHDSLGRIASVEGPSATGGTRQGTFSYDHGGRLVGVRDVIDGVCTTREYVFSANGNRTGLTSTTRADGCSATVTSTAAKTWSYDAADRVQKAGTGTGSYVYDALGRQTSVPAGDTASGSGDLAIAYYDTDAARSMTQAGVTTTYALDPAGRRATTSTTGGTSSTTVRHYTDTSDNPGWVTTTTGATTTTTRYTGSLGGDLGVVVTDGATSLALADPHGNTATTVQLGGTSPVVGALGSYDEYGNPLAPAPSTGAVAYGWLGIKERATEVTGLVLMGARLYNPITGLFTSVDPVAGGNTTAYTYPQDPANFADLDGLARTPRNPCYCGNPVRGIPVRWISHTRAGRAPGSWVRVNEAMSARAAQYQAQISGKSAGYSYQVNGVRFDGYANGILKDAKGPGYARFVKNGRFLPWFNGARALVDQARRQATAAGSTPIQWSVAEGAAAAAIRDLLARNGLSRITVVHVPAR